MASVKAENIEKAENEIEQLVEELEPYITFQFYLGDPLSHNQIKKVVHVPNIEILNLRDEDVKPVQIKGYISIFNDILEEITVMKCVMNEPQEDDWNKLVQYHTIHERYGRMADEFYDYNNNKNILRHLCRIYNIFHVGFLELLENYSYSVFMTGVKDYIHSMHDETVLLEETARHRHELRELKQSIMSEKKTLLDIIAKTNYKLFKLRESKEEKRAYGNMEAKYLRGWETARLDQKTYELKEKEEYYKNIVHQMSIKTNSENRIHHEIKTYTNEKIIDLRNEIEFWMEQYDTESEARDIELGKIRVEIEIQKEKLEKTINELEVQTKFIEDRLRLKEERRQAEARARLEKWAAIIIQAWWRGTMVRRFLGKYRKLRKKFGKGKKGKGKGKGKKGKKGKKK